MIDDSGIFPEQSLYFLFNKRTDADFNYLLGVLNSRLLTAYYRAKAITNKKSIAQVKKVDLDQLPIRTVDFKSPGEKDRHDRMVSLVERMLALHKQLAEAKTAHAKTNIQRQIDATDTLRGIVSGRMSSTCQRGRAGAASWMVGLTCVSAALMPVPA